MPKAWEPLKVGDSVAVINPCMNDRNGAAHAVQYQKLLGEEWGCNVNGLDELAGEVGHRLWSDTPERRAERVINAICNPDNKAIFLLVGGDGANETMKLVEEWHLKEVADGREGLPKRGIPVIGLSNNTTLLNPLAQMGIISPVQGKLDAAVSDPKHSAEKSLVTSGNAAALHDLLFGEVDELEFRVTPLNAAARSYAGEEESVEIVGGCNFHVIESARTPFELDAKGKYLAVEGPEEQCSVKETLEGLQREGMLDGVKAVFLGYVDGYDHREVEDEARSAAVEMKRAEVMGAAEKLDVPVYIGMPWGHIGPGNQTDVYLPLNTNAQLTLEGGSPVLKVSAARTQENLDEAYTTYREERGKFVTAAVEVDGDEMITSMEAMLQDAEHPSLRGKDVTLAFTPKYGDPVSHMMGVSQGLSALLHKGSLDRVSSLTLDLSGLYEADEDRPLYRKLDGTANPPPHRYNGAAVVSAIANEEDYIREIKSYLQDFSERHLGAIPVEVGRNQVAERVSETTGISVEDLQASYQKQDGTGRLDASAMAQDYRDGKINDHVTEFLEERSKSSSHITRPGLVKTSIDALDLAEKPESWAQRIKQQKEERAKGSGAHEV